MLIEYRSKHSSQGDWWQILPSKFNVENLAFEQFSYRIDKNRQYHREDTPGFVDAFNKIQAWRRLAGD